MKKSGQRNDYISSQIEFQAETFRQLEEITSRYTFLLVFIKDSQRRNFTIGNALDMKKKLIFEIDPANLLDYIQKRWIKHPLHLIEELPETPLKNEI